MDPNRPLVYSVGGTNYVKRQKTARNSKKAYIKKKVQFSNKLGTIYSLSTLKKCALGELIVMIM